MINGTFNYDFEYWELRHSVTFDGPNKLIIINDGIIDIEVTRDLYSAWKEWVRFRDNARFLPAFTAIGGEPLPFEGQFLDVTLFLINGWKIVSWEGEQHVVTIQGNLITDTGESPFINNGWGIFQSNVSAIFRVFKDTADQIGISDEDILRIQEAVVPAIWQALTIDYSGVAGSFAEAVSTIAASTGSAAVASAVWDALAVDHTVPDSMAMKLLKKKLLILLGDIIAEV